MAMKWKKHIITQMSITITQLTKQINAALLKCLPNCLHSARYCSDTCIYAQSESAVWRILQKRATSFYCKL